MKCAFYKGGKKHISFTTSKNIKIYFSKYKSLSDYLILIYRYFIVLYSVNEVGWFLIKISRWSRIQFSDFIYLQNWRFGFFFVPFAHFLVFKKESRKLIGGIFFINLPAKIKEIVLEEKGDKGVVFSIVYHVLRL